MNSINIKQINLGSDSAERDIEQGLLDYFYHNTSYQQFLSGKKTIIVGNRGVGKSAIFKFIASEERSKGTLVLELSPEEYSYEILAQVLKREKEGSWGKPSSFSISWQYLIYTLIFKEIVSSKKGLVTGSLKKIYDYVRDNLRSKDVNPIGLLISYLKRLETFKIGPFEATRKARELQALYSLEEISHLLPELKNVLEKTKVKVLVDELDKGWDNSEDAKYFIAGLFQAIQKINLLSPNLKVFVSIRQELFDNIPQIYDDAQKIREDIEVISWKDSELLELISLRIQHSLPQTQLLTSIERWNLLFAEVLAYRNTKSYNYIIDRTQLRPRELLQFCKACIKNYSGSEGAIDYNDITKAEAEYSEQKIKDLAAEYKYQFPYLLDLFEIFRGKIYTFESDELEYLLLSVESKELNLGKATWCYDTDYLELKKILWQVGFLKAWVRGGLKFGKKAGSVYLGYYESPNINLENITRFQVHPAFRTYLSMKEQGKR